MGKKSAASSNKNKEKRQARKLEQRRIADGMTYVTSANKLTDLKSLCKELMVYTSNDLDVDMYIQRVSELKKTVLEWAIDLTERNMKKLYETCAWGWNRDRKVEEMMDDSAWYIIAKEKNGTLLAFSHFRFDLDYGDPVLYCYEVQVEAEGRRRGLGQRVLRVLERLAHVTRMRAVRLTALTHNPSAAAFFRACGYSLDETSPPLEEAAHYEILSKATDSQADETTDGQQTTKSQHTTTDRQQSATDRQETTTDRQETATDRQEATSDRQETAADRQETATDGQDTATDRQQFSLSDGMRAVQVGSTA